MRKILNSIISVILCICMVVPMSGYVAAAKLGKVKNLKVKETTTSTVTLSWSKVSGAKSYRIYRYDSKKDEWVYVKKTSKTTTKVTDLSSAKSYKFRVRVYNDKNNKGSYSSSVKAVTKPKKVTSLSYSDLTTSTATLKWGKVTRATGYRVYQYDAAAKKWNRIKETSKTSLSVSGLNAGQAYKFKVRAYYKSGDTRKYGSYSSVLTVVAKPSKVNNLAVTNVRDTSYTLKWDKVTNAEEYEIYRYEASGWKKLDTTKSTSYVVRNASNEYVSYKVRAVVANGKSNISGAFSATVKAKANVGTPSVPSAPAVPEEDIVVVPVPGVTPSVPENLTLIAVPGEKSIDISWDAAENAKNYQVYKLNDDGSWSRIRTTSGTAIKYTVDKTGIYTFKVRAYNVVDGENVYGNFSQPSEVYYMSGDEDEANGILGDLENTGILGYLYDPEYNCFYTAENPWQRNFGFTPVYDFCAPFTVMFYETKRIKFNYDGLEWMVQIWKGQYGWVFIGAEIGVYTRSSALPLDFYECASDENMLNMSMVVLHGKDTIITRPYDKYWWCTGFVPGILPSAIVGFVSGGIDTSVLTMNARITMKDEVMRDVFCEALEQNGFVYGKDYFYSGLEVIFTWT
ncbi:MAG: DUF4474 domain-containing protein [Ruminococcaceae bacterium]|nr:DUF4474 domain-containing protein [Oscillospiraceae bacterium]